MIKRLSLLLLLLVFTAACAGRLPSQSTAKRVIHKHFKQYSKKYEASPFSGKKVTTVEILKIEEIHKHLAAATSFVTIEGPEVFKIRIVIEKGPFGWRTVHWENLSGGS